MWINKKTVLGMALILVLLSGCNNSLGGELEMPLGSIRIRTAI